LDKQPTVELLLLLLLLLLGLLLLVTRGGKLIPLFRR
jgi:hypothetical protein